MPSSPRRRPVRLLIAIAIGAGVLLPAASASADESGAATVVGELVRAWPEEAEPTEQHGSEAPLSWIRTAAGESVRVPTEQLADVPAGATVSVDVGAPVDDAAADDGYDPARHVLAADVLQAPPADTVPATADLTNQVTVAMVVPAGGEPDGTTPAQVAAAVNGPVASYWAAQSGGAIRLGVTAVHDWITTRAGCGDPNALWDETARAVGFVPGPGRHLVVYLSSRPADLPGCSFALGQVGSGPASGGRLYVRAAQPSVIAHELGHNFGLGHSSGRQCDDSVDTGACRTQGYRDYYDVMGASWSQMGALNAAQADRLGVLPAAARVDLAAGAPPAAYTLAPLAGPTGTRAIRLTAADGAVYWLEYRAATGQDGWLGTPDNRFRLDSGVLLHRAGGFPDTSLLLDGTPAAAAGWDGDLQSALPIGTPVRLADGFTITVQSLSASGARIAVSADPVAGSASPAATRADAPGGLMPGRGCAAAPGCSATGPVAGARQGTAAPATPSPDADAAPTGQLPASGGSPAAGASSSVPADRPVEEAALVSGTAPSFAVVAAVVVAGCAALVLLTSVLRRRLIRGRGRGTAPSTWTPRTPDQH